MAYPKGAAHPKLVGDRSTAMVLAKLHEIYEIILLPFGENQRYDLVVDTGDEFIRVQCKTGRLRDGVIRFNACSTTYHHPNRTETQPYRRAYHEQADVFGVYCPDNKKTYLVPVSEIGRRAGSLRVDRTLNNQVQGVRWAEDYELRTDGAVNGRGSRLKCDVEVERLF
jgi:hypothetical protein